MKQILLAFSLCAIFFAGHAQRLVPIISTHATWPMEPLGSIRDMDTLNGELLVVGNFSTINNLDFGGFLAYDGEEMHSYGTTLDNYNLSCVHRHEGFPIVGARLGSNVYNVLKWNGIEWAPMGDTLEDYIFDLNTFQNDLYISGRMDSVLMKWENNNWTGMHASHYDKAGDLFTWNNLLYTVFEDTIPAYYQNGVWHEFAYEEGMVNRVYTYAVLNNQLFVCGDFSMDGQSHGLMRIEGDNLVLDESIFVNNRVFKAIWRDGHALCLSNSFLYEDTDAILPASYISNLFGVPEYLQEFQGEIIIACGFDGPGFFGGGSFTHLYKYESGDAVAELGAAGNELICTIDADDDFFNTYNDPDGLIYPAGDSTRAVFAASLIACASMPDGEILTAASNYNLATDIAWISGPSADTVDQDYLDRYLKVWKLDASEITNHQANFTNPNYTMPDAIRSWPGNGRFDKGEAHMLAPFADLNGDSWYQPELGEFPEIMGDHAVFMILNDKFSIHASNFFGNASTEQNRMDLELHLMFYAYDNQPIPLNRTVFMHAAVFNRSDNDYTNLKLGVFNDFDLGNYFDDFTGCNPEEDYVFCYNQDNEDDDYISTENPSAQGYGENPPAVACVYLNQNLGVARSCESGSAIQLPAFPTRSEQFYNHLFENLDNLGNEIVIAGDTAEALMFPDSPCLIGGENEVTANQLGGDRIHVSASSSMELPADSYTCFDIAYTITGQTANYLNNACALEDIVPLIHDFYQNNNLSECSVVTNVDDDGAELNAFSFWPNPASDQLHIRHHELNGGIVQVFDVYGRLVLTEPLRKGSNEHVMNCTTLSQGAYVVRVGHAISRIIIRR